jgi:anti-anti-sigma regulatory factor
MEHPVPVTLEARETSMLIRLEGALDISSAAELKQLLLQALGSGRKLYVSLDNAINLEVTAVQLLWAAERQARTSETGFALAGAVPPGILSDLAQAGFQALPVPADAQ